MVLNEVDQIVDHTIVTATLPDGVRGEFDRS